MGYALDYYVLDKSAASARRFYTTLCLTPTNQHTRPRSVPSYTVKNLIPNNFGFRGDDGDDEWLAVRDGKHIHISGIAPGALHGAPTVICSGQSGEGPVSRFPVAVVSQARLSSPIQSRLPWCTIRHY